MIISGPSKAGKSWSLVQLAIALQNGTDWMGHKIMKRTKTLYVNMEIPEDEMQDRFWQVRKAIG